MTASSNEKRARGEAALQIYQALRREVLDMSLAPGVPLDEKTIAARYAVSRSPVREAIIRLSADGLVRIPCRTRAPSSRRSTSKSFPPMSMRST